MQTNTADSFQIEITNIESPFPITDCAHKGQFMVKSYSIQPNTLLGYVVSLIANINNKEILLMQDNSADHGTYHRISGGTFMFNSAKLGQMCIEEINLSDFPVPLANNKEEHIHFYLIDIDIIESLKLYSITDAKSAQDKACVFKIKVEAKLAQSNPNWNTTAEQVITIK